MAERSQSTEQASELHALTQEHWQLIVRLLPQKFIWPEDIKEDLIDFANAQIRGLSLNEDTYLGNRHWNHLSYQQWEEEKIVPRRFWFGANIVLEESSVGKEIREYATSRRDSIVTLNDVFNQSPDEFSRGYIISLGSRTFIGWNDELFAMPGKLNNEWQMYHLEDYQYYEDTADPDGLGRWVNGTKYIWHPHLEFHEDIQIILDRYLLTLEDLKEAKSMEDVLHIAPPALHKIALGFPDEELLWRLKAQIPDKKICGWEKSIPQVA